MSYPRLVADIGGTHARFALIGEPGGRPSSVRVLRCRDHDDLGAAMEAYLAAITIDARPRRAAVALATAITGDRVTLTNHAWSFSIEETRRRLGLERVIALNDFTALALALPHLGREHLQQIGGGAPVSGTALGLLGPGTGLGASGLLPVNDGWVPLTGEGGHVTLAASDEREAALIGAVRQNYAHVSAERLLSGPGLVNLYRAVATLENAEAQDLAAKTITERGASGDCALCAQTLEHFCALLGTVAGNLALTLGARGGVYIGGGIVPALGEFFAASAFRQRFEAKGRFRDYLRAIPCYVIHAPYPALLGAAQAFDRTD